jgi:hypothetical protein
MTFGLYVYGIFPEPIPETVALKGLDSQPVYSQVIDGFTFLYSEAQQEKYLASRRNLINHEKVLEQATAFTFWISCEKLGNSSYTTASTI